MTRGLQLCSRGIKRATETRNDTDYWGGHVIGISTRQALKLPILQMFD